MTPLAHISGESHVAAVYGLEEAIFLHSLMFWYRTNRGNNQNFQDGRWWTYNSVKAFEDIFPWWNGGQIRRIITRCREKGALLAGNYNQDQRDRTAWYTPSDALLELYGEIEPCICRKQQMELPETAASFDENGEPLPCSNHVGTDNTPYSPPDSPADCRPGRSASPNDGPGDGAAGGQGDFGVEQSEASASAPDKPKKPRRTRRKASVPTHAPERFEQFWAVYPVGGSRLKAVEAWDALAPSEELIDEMARALKRQMRSRAWREGIGIPHACRWLSNQRWTDKLPEEPPPRGAGGWADDPEVSS